MGILSQRRYLCGSDWMPKELILILRSPLVLATVPALHYQHLYRPYRLTVFSYNVLRKMVHLIYNVP